LFPPAPGVVPLALALMVPLIVALPYTARMTGLVPVSVNVLPLAIVRLAKTRMSAFGPPPVCAMFEWMMGAVPEHEPVVNECDVEL
jgi:hypothetical protein